MNQQVESVSLPTVSADTEAVKAPALTNSSQRQWWRRPSLLVSAIIVLALITGIAWWAIQAREDVQYVTVVADRGAVSKTVSATGTVNPVLTVTVGSYVSGVVQDVLCDFNSKVTKGQVCAHIDPRPFQSVVDEAQATLDVAKAQLQKDNANLDYTKLSFDRNTRLVAQNAVSQDAADDAKSVYDQAQAEIGLDNATIEQRQAELNAAQINLAYTDILSPVDGTVVSRNVTAGQTVASSLQTPTLFLIAQDLTSMEVDNNISESDIGAIKSGEKATFTVDAYPGRSFTGVVAAVRQAPQSVQNVVTYDVIVDVSNPDLALMPGMTASTQFVVDSRDNALRVPSQALRYRPSGSANLTRVAEPPAAGGTQQTSATRSRVPAGVSSGSTSASGAPGQIFVLRDGRPIGVAVQTGLDDGSFTEITSGGIQAGDQVIVGESSGGAARATQSAAPRLGL